MSSVDDPVLKELLTAFRQDVHQLADDIGRGMWVQAAISMVAFFLALSSTIRLLVEIYLRYQRFPVGPRCTPSNLSVLIPQIVLDIILFTRSILAIRSNPFLRT